MSRKTDPSDVAAIAQRLTQAVENSNPPITRRKLADRLRLTPGAVSHYLNGDRPCPHDVVVKIARITRTEPGWLLRGTLVGRLPNAATRNTAVESVTLSWGFREAPPDGGKDFGNAGVYATPPAVKTVVREDGQNSLDAGQGREVTLRFRIIELSPTSKRYERVLRAVRFDQLERHIASIRDAEYESKLGTKLTSGVERIRDDKLVVLIVDDYATHGLEGDEFDSSKAYAALVRDNLNSRKDSSTAGGVFGVGAKVNIACSVIGTVLIASKIKGQENRGTRLVGRSELTYHELRTNGRMRSYAGPAWLGVPGSRKDVMESVWLSDDDRLLDDLMMRRDQLPPGVRDSDATGTSIMIVGFTDHQTESGATTQQLAEQLSEGVAANFWPAIVKGQLTVWIERYVDDSETPVKSEQVDPRSISGVAQLCDAYEKYVSGAPAAVLSQPGDVATAIVPLTVPATRSRTKGVRHHDETVAECTLVVRLATNEDLGSDPRAGHIAYVRGRAMVVRYQPRTNVVVGGRPFHAAVFAGTFESRTAEQIAAEQFLRIAEPPAHDRWIYSSDVGDRYARGAKKCLDEFHARVTEELQRLLRPAHVTTQDGPEALKRLLQFRAPKDSASKQPQVRVLNGQARVLGGTWNVEADVSINPTPKALRLEPRLAFLTEGSAPIRVRWETLELVDGTAEPADGAFLLKPRTKRITFRGTSDPDSHPAEAVKSVVVLDVLASFVESDE